MKVTEFGALLMVIVAVLVVSFLALKGSEAALGALLGVMSTGTGYFLRGKIQAPG